MAVTPLYKCAMKDLYTVLKMIWTSYQQNLQKFTDYKGFYIQQYGLDAVIDINKAKAMPDEQERGEPSESAFAELKPIGVTCCKDFQKLKGYIRSAFSELVWKAKFEATGADYYTDAAREDWDSVSEMNQRMINFLNGNQAALLAGNNMPATFTQKVIDDAAKFETKYDLATGSSDTGAATDAKITANNAVYKFAMDSICADAPSALEDTPALIDLFIFSKRLEEINPKERGAKGGVEETTTNIPLTDYVLTFKKVGDPIITAQVGEDFKYKVQLTDGDYDWQIVCPDHILKNGNITIDGTMKTLNIELDKNP